MKNYTLIFKDKKGNELTSNVIEAKNKKEAKKIANKLKANSMLNDLNKIIINNKN
jgi:hypothetical protein